MRSQIALSGLWLTERPAFQGHFDVALVFECDPAEYVPADECELRENADGQHFPYAGVRSMRRMVLAI
jgi:hypothetical protein